MEKIKVKFIIAMNILNLETTLLIKLESRYNGFCDVGFCATWDVMRCDEIHAGGFGV